MKRTPKLAIVMLNFNGASHAIECARSLEASDYPEFKLIIVDNGSTDDSFEMLKAACGKHEIHKTGRNLGFGAGMNYCFEIAKKYEPDYILSVNNDVIFDPAAVRLLVEAMEEHPDAAAANGTIYAYHDRRLIWYGGGRMINWRGLAIHERKGEHVAPENLGETREVSFVTGCVVIYRASAMRVFGQEDERFFLCLEDIELSARMQARGFRLLYVPRSIVYHKVLDEKLSPIKVYYSMRNRLLYIHTSLSGPTRFLATAYFLSTLALKLPAWRVALPWAYEAATCGLGDYYKGQFYEAQGLKRFAPKLRSLEGKPT